MLKMKNVSILSDLCNISHSGPYRNIKHSFLFLLAFATVGDGMYMHVYLKEYYLQVLVSQQEIETFLHYTDRPTDQ